MSASLHLKPISLRAANAYVSEVHRHHGPTRGHKFSVSVVDESGEIHGVGIAGRPVSRVLDQQGYIEITRIATDGTGNAPSMLYGGLRRAALALGYPPYKIITYTLTTESGASVRAAGFIRDGESSGGSWSRSRRPRDDKAPIIPKTRWAAGRAPEGTNE